MASQLKKNECWKKPYTWIGDGFVEVIERKTAATTFVALMLAWFLGWLALGAIILAVSGTMDLGFLVAIAIVNGIPLALVLLIYRPPLSLRLFPEEMLARRCRVFIGLKIKVRWYDLSEAPIDIERRMARGDEEISAGGVALGCLSVVLGPLGLLFLFFPRNKAYEQIPMYCLTQSNTGLDPIAIFEHHETAAQLADLYKAMDERSL